MVSPGRSGSQPFVCLAAPEGMAAGAVGQQAAAPVHQASQGKSMGKARTNLPVRTLTVI